MDEEQGREPHPIPDSYWAGEHLLAGPRPAHAERATQRKNCKALLAAGVRCVIDLTAPNEPATARVLLQRLDEELVWIRVPILNGDVPSVPALQTILDLIDLNTKRERVTYVHCQGGLGRTGTVVACHWIRHGEMPEGDTDAIIEELKRRREGQPHGHKSSPETGRQLRLIRSWKAGM